MCNLPWPQLASGSTCILNPFSHVELIGSLNQVLGRASELGSFVKMGKGKGYIEIELKGPKGRPNLVIRRMLTAGSKGSKFTLNGTSATAREITSKVAGLNVQVGNLWFVSIPAVSSSFTTAEYNLASSFLPQDKVSEFAQMNSCQLLRETQRAAGDEMLTKWHDTLISSGKEFKSLQDACVSPQGITIGTLIIVTH